jgi:hypothetical protein
MTYVTQPLPGMVELAPGVWRRQDSDEPVVWTGSIHSNRYHRATCHYVNRIRPRNALGFRDEQAARAYGYVACRACLIQA